MKLKVVSLFLALVALAVSCSPSFSVYDLRCEGLDEPLGIDSTQPHFSWKISSANPVEQASYEIQVASTVRILKSGKADLWDSGKVPSADQVMVLYFGKQLISRQLAWWRVRVCDASGKYSSWSEPRRFAVGVVEGDSLKGEYIGAVPGEGRSSLLRKDFNLDKVPGTAFLYVNSLGYHEVYLNGEKVSEAVLNPAVSQLDKRSLIVTYDVTSLLSKGENEIVIWASSGWYKPRTFKAAYEGPLVKAELDAITPEGAEPLMVTDKSWQGTWSGYNDYDTWGGWHFGGETIDAGRVPSSMSRESLDKLEWEPVDVVDIQGIEATPMMCEPCLPQETLLAASVEPYGESGESWIVDFGRIVNGLLDIKLPALPEGHKSTASFFDDYEDDGTFNPPTRNYYISSGSGTGDRFTNKFNHHVFRYVLLDSLPTAPKPEDIKAIRMRTSYSRASSFECSDPEMNAIHDMVSYTLENLAFDGYMVDCANFERLGYGGDGNASTLTIQTMFDVSPLYLNWLQAWNDVIHEDGSLPHTAPCPGGAGGGPYWCSFIVQAPWRTWMNYADPRLLERCYPTMKHWLDYVDAYTVDGLLKKWPDTGYRAWYLGDWAAPFDLDTSSPGTVDLVNNCAIVQVYTDMEKIASVMGLPSQAVEYKTRREALSDRINEVFYNPDEHIYGTGSQIDMVYPMLVGIVPEGELKEVRDCLLERTESLYGGHLYTGLVGVPVISEWASLAGEVNWMYGMLKQHSFPGYLYMIDHGASGTWEYWSHHRSRLHNCYNGIGSWFYQALGGIIPDKPGYRHVRIAPQVPEGLEWVKVTKETPYGTIVVDRNGDKLHFELPVGISATVKGAEYTCGSHDVEL